MTKDAVSWAGLLLLALVSVPPLLAGSGAAAVLLLMLLALAARAALDRRDGPLAAAVMPLCAGLSVLLTACHWWLVDADPVRAEWQRDTYRRILAHTMDAPHQYRPLPYGFVRLLEEVTGRWLFSCLAYRWFFTAWFLWASYRLARLYHGPALSLVVLAPVVLLYPLSVLYYWGQLTDPLSHFLFVLGLVYLLEDRPGPLAAALALALGVLAKETAVLLVPVYLACHWRQGAKAWATTALLGGAAVAAFVAARSPSWRPGFAAINGTTGLMVGTNLGIGPPIATTSVPLWGNYAHPLLFVGPFLPALAWNGRRLEPRLFTACVTLTPLLLLSNLCFGWLYESRNYMPLLPLLTAAALPPTRGRAASAKGAGRRQ